MKRRPSVPGSKPTIPRVSYVLGAFNAIRRSFALLPIAFFLFVAESSTFALDPHQSVDQLYHSAWGPKQGITGAVTALAQTTDGYLWLGTTDGLLRFNGISFERYQPESGQLVANAISALLAVPDDGLWVGFVRGGASFLKNGHVANYTEAQGFPVSKVRALVRDNAGVIWAAAIGGLTRFDGERWHNIGKDWNYPTKSAWTLFTDREGRLWAATGESIVVLPMGATKFQDTRIACSEVHGITQAPDGSLVIDDEVANRLRALRLDSDGKPTTLPDIPVPSGVPFVDRDGSLWVATTHGVVRVPFLDWSRADKTQAQFFAEKQGLTNDTTADVIEDREGNVWVGTQEGLDRFRNRNLSWFSLPGSYLTLVAGPRGDVWAASADPWPVPFLRVRDRKGVGIGPAAIYAAFRDRDGSVWYSGPNALIHWQDGRFIKIPVPAPVVELSLSTKPRAPITASSITKDSSGALWVAFGGSGEFRLGNGNWTFVSVLPEHPDWAANYAFTDDLDRVWLCWGDRVARLDHGAVQVFDARQGLSVGPFNVAAGKSQEIWIGGESGLAVFEGGKFHTVDPAEGHEFRSVTGIVVTATYGVWLSAASCIVHIPEAEVNLLRHNPRHRVNVELFDMISDLPEPLQPNTVWSSGAIEAPDRMLWFPTQHGAVQVDPAHIFRNPLPPPVRISAMIADNRSYSSYPSPILPPATQNLVIRYDALSLTVPERVRFRYKLDPWDTDWHYTDGRREAFFTHLTPGSYVFHVIASNNSDVWNNEGATLKFVVEPTWYQTGWFRFACLPAALLVFWSIYRLRLRQIAKSANERFDERLGERIRIARELHDTLVQTIQGSKMVVDDALETSEDPARARHALKQLSTWLEQATEESRAALYSLRSSVTVKNDLAEALRRATESGHSPNGMSVTFSVVGTAREMHPVVRDEIYRIAFEAIRNALTHSRASRLDVELLYRQDLSIVVSDNGLGIDPALVESGREGHFGLQGMRERAERIRGKLTIMSSGASGTRIMFTVPGVIAFSDYKLGPLSRVHAIITQLINHLRSQ